MILSLFSHNDSKIKVCFYTLTRCPKIGEYYNDHENDNVEVSISYRNYKFRSKPEVIFDVILKDFYDDNKDKEIGIDFSQVLDSMILFNGPSKLRENFGSIILSHNGIIIPTDADTFRLGLNFREDYLTIGYIQLYDNLRPNLSVSRGETKSLPWPLWSSLNYTIRRNFPDEYANFKKISFIYSTNVAYSHQDLNDDYLLTDNKYWASEKIFLKNMVSLNDIITTPDCFKEVFNRDNNLVNVLQRKLIELNATYQIELYKYNNGYRNELVKKGRVLPLKYGIKDLRSEYPPLIFCEYLNFEGLMPEKLSNQIFNIKHPFSKWLIHSFDFLSKNYPNQIFILLNNDDLNIVNQTISTLRLHLPKFYSPPDSLSLSEDDFKVNFDKIPDR